MKRCPITYQEIGESETYSQEGLRRIAPKLKKLLPLAYTSEEQIREATRRSVKMSIQGVQPKLSARLHVQECAFCLVDCRGTYILKPQHPYFASLPEIEDLTMKLAALVDIETPPHGLVYAKDNSLTYFIKRFDRFGRNKKRMQEDFAQLTGHSRDTKYNSSIEEVVRVVETHCTFPAIENIRLFRLILFSFLVGNEDLHLKNFSLIGRDGCILLSPAYDLVNTTLVLPHTPEEMALPLKGKKKGFRKNIFISYLAKERLRLNDKVIEQELARFFSAQIKWKDLIDKSFLSPERKSRYWEIVQERSERIFGYTEREK